MSIKSSRTFYLRGAQVLDHPVEKHPFKELLKFWPNSQAEGSASWSSLLIKMHVYFRTGQVKTNKNTTKKKKIIKIWRNQLTQQTVRCMIHFPLDLVVVDEEETDVEVVVMVVDVEVKYYSNH